MPNTTTDEDAVELPRMRSRKKCSDAKSASELRDAAATLAESECTFWACRGPCKPQIMVTCSKCWAIRDIMRVVAALERRANE